MIYIFGDVDEEVAIDMIFGNVKRASPVHALPRVIVQYIVLEYTVYTYNPKIQIFLYSTCTTSKLKVILKRTDEVRKFWLLKVFIIF